MAGSVRVALPSSHQTAPNRFAMAIVSLYTRLDVPYAPQETDHDGLARKTEQLDRAGYKPFLRVGGPQLRQETFTLIVAYPDPQRSIEPILSKIKALAEHADPVQVRYGPLEAGIAWRITDLSIRGVMRKPHTPISTVLEAAPGNAQDLTRAQVTMTLTEVSNAALHISAPVKKATPTPPRPAPKPSTAPSKSAPPPASPTVYVVRSGDTLSHIAARLLGDSDRYPEIARLNGLSNPNRIQVGQRLRIPKR